MFSQLAGFFVVAAIGVVMNYLPTTSAAHYSDITTSQHHAWNNFDRPSPSAASRRISSLAFQFAGSSPILNHQKTNVSVFQQRRQRIGLKNSGSSNNDVDSNNRSSFLSTNKANVSFKSNSSSNSGPANLSAIDSLLINVTSDRTSIFLGSVGIFILLLNRVLSFPEDAVYEASRSRIDLLGVFAAGSVLLNGISKLDVESVTAEQVALEGVNESSSVVWNNDNTNFMYEGNKDKVEWALFSFLKCTPARTAVMLGKKEGEESWVPLAMTGILPLDPSLRTSLRSNSTPILDRMLRDDGNIKGGTVGGTEVVIGSNRKGAKESYLPTLQALPGKIEFSYLPSNAQEALLLPVPPKEGESCRYAVVLGGDRAKSFAPRDISWCREIASWL